MGDEFKGFKSGFLVGLFVVLEDWGYGCVYDGI
jgi:hypothetical protein